MLSAQDDNFGAIQSDRRKQQSLTQAQVFGACLMQK
jgi:hypothetical protein